MYRIKRSQRFKKDYKQVCKRADFREEVFTRVLDILVHNRQLPKKYKEHTLRGEFQGCVECHIQFDVLLIYQLDHTDRTLYVLRIGSHQDLF